MAGSVAQWSGFAMDALLGCRAPVLPVVKVLKSGGASRFATVTPDAARLTLDVLAKNDQQAAEIWIQRDPGAALPPALLLI